MLQRPTRGLRQSNRPAVSGVKILLGVSSAILLYAVSATPVQQNVQMTPEAVASFEAKVRPVLLAKCVACHGPNQQIAELRLDRAISPQMAQKVAAAISYTKGTKMPPAGKLPKDEITALTAWTTAGAPWPTAKASGKSTAKFWAFQPPVEPRLPAVKVESWAQNPLDRFILAKLEEKGLKPSSVADRRTLIRRATFDLTGLPPTPKEIEDFIADKQPNAFERLVDRLLATPAYGERWGRHWLDVARFADSNGLDENLVFANAWRYRDWVINAIYEDKPINRFMQEQIAGDLLPGASDAEVIATGYLALGAKMLAEDDPVKQEMDIIDEQVDTVSKAFLGLTIGCARCHDHKFDPVSAKDYYALAGIFKSTKTMQNFKVVADWNERPLGSKINQEKAKQIEAEIKKKADAAASKRKAESEALTAQLQLQLPLYLQAAQKLIATQNAKSKLKPILSEPNSTSPKGAIIIEAESFTEGNVGKDRENYGKGIGVLYNIGQFPNRAEYEVTAIAEGPYQLDLRYASAENRPIQVFVNDKLAVASAAEEITGGFFAQHQKWITQGVVTLKKGANKIRFERQNYFPHIDKFMLVPAPGQAPTIAESNSDSLIHEVVVSVAEQIKESKPVKIELPEKRDHLFTLPAQTELKQIDKSIESLRKQKPSIPLAMAVEEGKPTDLKVHLRGNYLTLGEESPRKFPSVISDPADPAMPKNASGRLEFARWLTSNKNPMTARVFVNRIWRWKFGKGLVGTTDNFGILGELPSHPELLDWLALKFTKEDNWSLKKLQKRLMLTNTYMMSGTYNAKAAELDPDNRLLWRAPRRRLEAEAIRDSIWFVAGKLDRKMGGTMLNLPPRAYVSDTNSEDKINYDSPRRAVYLPVVRAALYDVYTAFDFGDPSVMNGDRSSTTVAPQALFMLNSKVTLTATKSQAETLLKQQNVDDRQRVRSLYLTCYGRPATEPEIDRALAFVDKFKASYATAKDPRLSAWQSLCKAVIASNEFIYVE